MFSLITSTCPETFKNDVYSLKTSLWGSLSPHSKQKYFDANLKITIILVDNPKVGVSSIVIFERFRKKKSAKILRFKKATIGKVECQ